MAALGYVSAGQLTSGDGCPSDNVMTDFDLGKYMGRWYEYRPSVDQAMRQKGADCIQADYSLRDDGLVRVFNSEQVREDEGSPFQERRTLEGEARLALDRKEGMGEAKL